MDISGQSVHVTGNKAEQFYTNVAIGSDIYGESKGMVL